ncbi:uncharacterized protein LOC116307236 [Actinia tenebrosa]|uniref:Uncharacterized protein LOC116307236 n=1 Tax=Actinia tenebrosa TaxID=6105 RepID=A0A6P8J0A5_ACTTE|nr:uncharacterized protein LOC116307236 [Actinia tenebrosa]
MAQSRVLVIGAGVMGLTTALELVQHGYQVTVLSKDFMSPDNKSKLTSQVAAGLWKIPVHSSDWRDDKVRENIRRWALRSYAIYSKLSQDDKNTGVYFRPRINLYYTKINDDPKAKLFLEDHCQLPGFRHSDQIIAEYGFSTTCGLVDAFLFHAPLVDTDVFLSWLTGQCTSNGVNFVQETIHGPLRPQRESLMKKYKAGHIVNCTGVNARELAEDNDVYPMTGAGLILNFSDAPFHCPRFGAEVHNHWHDDRLNVGGKGVIVFRGASLWLGTIEHPSYDTNLDVKHPFITRMLREVQTVYPPLQTISEDNLQVTVGVRPMRTGSPRVEQDSTCPYIIHNYGHRGLGIMMTWGCAEDVLKIIMKSQSMGPNVVQDLTLADLIYPDIDQAIDSGHFKRRLLFTIMFHSTAQQPSFKRSKGRILVIGAGVIGLTTALELVQHGYQVTVLAKDFVALDNKSKLTSQVAAAFWSMPVHAYKWKDQHMERKIREWTMHGYRVFSKLASNSEETGVFMRTRINAYYNNINDVQSDKIYEDDHSSLPGFRHSRQILKERGISEETGLVDATSFLAPLTDADVFMMWLTKQCMSNGVNFVRESLHGPLRTQCDSLMKKYQVDRIVNCSGVNARELAEDNDVYPATGLGLMVNNTDSGVKPIDFALSILGKPTWYDDKTNTSGFIGIAPRGNHGLWIGTIKQESYKTDFHIDDPITSRMLSECQKVYPPLKNIPQDKIEITVGRRPIRKGGPRVEQDPNCPGLVHNYGHCSFGIFLSWGCAREILNIMEKSTIAKSSSL